LVETEDRCDLDQVSGQYRYEDARAIAKSKEDREETHV
jgi:hypothetical protein